jgi:hypothetical protein
MAVSTVEMQMSRSLLALGVLMAGWMALAQAAPAQKAPSAEPVEQTAPPDSQIKKSYTRITLISFPAGAKVFIDDSLAGTTPFETRTLPPGNHVLRLNAEGFQEFQKEDQLAAMSHRKIIVHMVSLYASLSARSLPPGAAVSLNGTRVGTTPFDTTKLTPGVYTVDFDLEKYLPCRMSLSAVQNRHDTLVAQLVSKAYHDSIATVAKKNRQLARRILFGIAASGFGLAGLIENHQAAGHLDKEAGALASYNKPGNTADQFSTYWNTYQAEQKNADKAMRARNVLYGIAGVFIAGVAISIPF